MELINLNEMFTAILHIPESLPGNVVTYNVYRLSSGAVFQSGNAAYLAGIQWKVQFNPNVSDVFLVEVYDTVQDVRYTQIYRTSDAPKANTLYTIAVSMPESKNTDVVTYTIYKTDGTILSSGSMTFVSSIHWKVSFTPPEAGTFKAEVKNTTLDVTYSEEIIVLTAASLTVDTEPTSAEMITQINKAIMNLLKGNAVQSYSISGRNIQYMTLSELKQMRSELQKELNGARGPARNYASFDAF